MRQTRAWDIVKAERAAALASLQADAMFRWLVEEDLTALAAFVEETGIPLMALERLVVAMGVAHIVGLSEPIKQLVGALYDAPCRFGRGSDELPF